MPILWQQKWQNGFLKAFNLSVHPAKFFKVSLSLLGGSELEERLPGGGKEFSQHLENKFTWTWMPVR